MEQITLVAVEVEQVQVTAGNGGSGSSNNKVQISIIMTSTIKVNNIQNQCGQNIINESSNTITIGASGDTIGALLLASGASQTGFGRTGTVDWQTTKKTASFTAVSGEGYFVDTSSSAITANTTCITKCGSNCLYKRLRMEVLEQILVQLQETVLILEEQQIILI